jgi:hypothetical protein
VVLAGNFDVDLESLLVVLQRLLVLTLAVVNITDAEVGFGHVRGVVAFQGHGSNQSEFMHAECMLIDGGISAQDGGS